MSFPLRLSGYRNDPGFPNQVSALLTSERSLSPYWTFDLVSRGIRTFTNYYLLPVPGVSGMQPMSLHPVAFLDPSLVTSRRICLFKEEL